MTDRSVTFARRVFTVAAVYGILVLAPQYFLADRIGRDFPPPITHLEHYYGFIGIALAWQVVFLIIASSPLRYRPLMLAAVLEKLAFGVPCLVLYLQGRLSGYIMVAGALDLVLGVFFVTAYLAVPRHKYAS